MKKKTTTTLKTISRTLNRDVIVIKRILMNVPYRMGEMTDKMIKDMEWKEGSISFLRQ